MRTALALAAGTLALTAAAPFATADDRPDLPAAGSEGMEIVAQIPGSGGTDLEFFSRAVADRKNANGTEVPEATGNTRHFAVVGNQERNARIVDITDPEHPFVAAEIACTLSQGDIQVNEARSLVVIANGTGSSSDRCQYTDASGATQPMPPGAAIVDISATCTSRSSSARRPPRPARTTSR